MSLNMFWFLPTHETDSYLVCRLLLEKKKLAPRIWRHKKPYQRTTATSHSRHNLAHLQPSQGTWHPTHI